VERGDRRAGVLKDGGERSSGGGFQFSNVLGIISSCFGNDIVDSYGEVRFLSEGLEVGVGGSETTVKLPDCDFFIGEGSDSCPFR
jgi:hypothetical protein